MIRFIAWMFGILTVAALAGAGGVLFVFYQFGRDLPAYSQLAVYEPPTTSRIYAGDGRLLTEYAKEPRVFVPIAAIPQRVIDAVLSAEDQNFYSHPGVDVTAVVRAVLFDALHWGERRPIGASTITQQVAKLPGLSLLGTEVTPSRKIKEMILSFRIEKALPKDRILEIYLNEIYLGFGSYGVAQAALNYFNKPLDELSIAEVAYLAALPKGPTNYHPIRHPDAAKDRRDWVVGRMLETGKVTRAEAEMAQATPFQINPRAETPVYSAEYFTEEVRRELAQRFGSKDLYGGGLSVRTTLDPRLQDIATKVLRAGLEDYDRRHGWRGPVTRIEHPEVDWQRRLMATPVPTQLGDDRRLALVLAVADDRAEIGFSSGSRGILLMKDMAWARKWREGQRVGVAPKKAADVLTIGDVIAVEALPQQGNFALRQIPNVDGALVALDPHTGRVLAMVGGYSYATSQFNRATQAMRQPGSAFKPFVYMAGLDHGFTPASLVLDAPFVLDQGPGLGKWKPANYSQTFYGPSTLRLGIEKSRNLMTVRLAQYVGMDTVGSYAKRFGVVDQLPPLLSMALGSSETTLMRLTAAYAEIVNGGKAITPTLIDRVQDRNGKTIFRHDARPCVNCANVKWFNQGVPQVPDNRAQIVDAVTAYQMTSMLEGVVQRGTGRTVASVGKPLAGKTGTTDDAKDNWFVGFAPDLAVGVYVGFDSPRTLGGDEQGATTAAPIFRDFMAQALKGRPTIPFRIPAGVRLVRINAETGKPAAPGDKEVILEAFKPGTELTAADALVLDYGFVPFDGAQTRGLY